MKKIVEFLTKAVFCNEAIEKLIQSGHHSLSNINNYFSPDLPTDNLPALANWLSLQINNSENSHVQYMDNILLCLEKNISNETIANNGFKIVANLYLHKTQLNRGFITVGLQNDTKFVEVATLHFLQNDEVLFINKHFSTIPDFPFLSNGNPNVKMYNGSQLIEKAVVNKTNKKMEAKVSLLMNELNSYIEETPENKINLLMYFIYYSTSHAHYQFCKNMFNRAKKTKLVPNFLYDRDFIIVDDIEISKKEDSKNTINVKITVQTGNEFAKHCLTQMCNSINTNVFEMKDIDSTIQNQLNYRDVFDGKIELCFTLSLVDIVNKNFNIYHHLVDNENLWKYKINNLHPDKMKEKSANPIDVWTSFLYESTPFFQSLMGNGQKNDNVDKVLNEVISAYHQSKGLEKSLTNANFIQSCLLKFSTCLSFNFDEYKIPMLVEQNGQFMPLECLGINDFSVNDKSYLTLENILAQSSSFVICVKSSFLVLKVKHAKDVSNDNESWLDTMISLHNKAYK